MIKIPRHNSSYFIFKVVLIISGNLSFLNWLTILPSLCCFDDKFLLYIFPLKSVRKTVIDLQKGDNKDEGTLTQLGKRYSKSAPYFMGERYQPCSQCQCLSIDFVEKPYLLMHLSFSLRKELLVFRYKCSLAIAGILVISD